jgi:hypothetical protein
LKSILKSTKPEKSHFKSVGYIETTVQKLLDLRYTQKKCMVFNLCTIHNGLLGF